MLFVSAIWGWDDTITHKSLTPFRTDEVAVLVYDTDDLDALLQTKWNAMKACLWTGDVQGATAYYSSATRSNYQAIFTALGDQLPQIAQQMQDIEPIYAEEGYAKYRIRRDEIN